MSRRLLSPLIEPDELAGLIGQAVILDCRAKLGEPDWGAQAYLEGHIETALYVSLDQDLAAPANEQGRHPLPDPQDWQTRIRQWGIANDQPVVVYDDALGAYAARAWWMFMWAGHRNIAVLNGGLATWSAPLSTQTSSPKASDFILQPSLVQLSQVDDVLALIDSDSADTQLLDARHADRWAGRTEPIDPIAGHIPGAVCFDFQGNCAPDGRFKTREELRTHYADVMHQKVVCYCGSGVTAAHNVLALTLAGHSDIALYADSWSGWITDPSRPIARAGARADAEE